MSSTDGAENMFLNLAVTEKQNEQPLTYDFSTEVKKAKSGRLIKMPDRLIFQRLCKCFILCSRYYNVKFWIQDITKK